VAHDVGALDAELVEDGADVAGLRPLVVAAGGVRGQAHATQVGHDDGVVLRELGGHRRPHVAGVAEAVDQHDRGPVAADADVDRRVGVHHLRAAEVGREGRGRGARRQGAQRQAGGEAGRDSAEAAGERGRNGCGHDRLLRWGDGHPGFEDVRRMP